MEWNYGWNSTMFHNPIQIERQTLALKWSNCVVTAEKAEVRTAAQYRTIKITQRKGQYLKRLNTFCNSIEKWSTHFYAAFKYTTQPKQNVKFGENQRKVTNFVSVLVTGILAKTMKTIAFYHIFGTKIALSRKYYAQFVWEFYIMFQIYCFAH